MRWWSHGVFEKRILKRIIKMIYHVYRYNPLYNPPFFLWENERIFTQNPWRLLMVGFAEDDVVLEAIPG